MKQGKKRAWPECGKWRPARSGFGSSSTASRRLGSGDVTAVDEQDRAELEQMRQKALEHRARMSRDLRNQARAVEEARRLADIDRRAEECRRVEDPW
jgi:hypothetical protein